MASSTGVNNSRRGKTTRGKKGKRLIWIGGGAIALILYMDRKGSAANNSAGTSNGQLAAYQQGVQDGGSIASGTTSGGGGGSDTGGGGGGSTGGGTSPTDTTPSGNGTATAPPAIGAVVINAPSKPRNNAKHHKTKKTGNGHKPPSNAHHGASGAHQHAGKPAPVKRNPGRSVPKPAASHPTRPAPASHNGTHKDTSRVDHKGKAKKSPVEEMPLNHSSGVVVLGRAFPGATGHRFGPPRRTPGGGIVREVTIVFGGRTEVHTVNPHTREWETNTRGRNPLQNRTVPQIEAA